MPGLDISAAISAPPQRILKAFFEPQALHAWWEVSHAVTTPRVLGPYAVSWETTEFRDAVLGRLGGVFRGTVMQYQADRGFFVADAFWLPPVGDRIGPLGLVVVCTPSGMEGNGATHVHVTQQGCDDSERWRRYYEVVAIGWTRALASLKALLEK